ncbi:MAG: hypothetical protein JW384_01196 [Nitrosomonadaceae bacterium]|nr:hypothetical protein [Nitrosomonadaceae bacterium]
MLMDEHVALPHKRTNDIANLGRRTTVYYKQFHATDIVESTDTLNSIGNAVVIEAGNYYP